LLNQNIIDNLFALKSRNIPFDQDFVDQIAYKVAEKFPEYIYSYTPYS